MRAYAETPLDRLLRRHGMNRNMLAKDIATIEVENSGDSDTTDLKRKFRSYKGELSRYARGEREPSLAMYLLMLDRIGCNSSELLPVLRPNKYVTLLGKHGVGNYGSRTDLKDEELVAKGHTFVCLEVSITVIYYNNCLYGTKRFIIKSLQDDLEQIENLDCYKCVTDGEKKAKLTSSKGVDLKEVNGFDSSRKFVSVEFKKALKKGEEIEFSFELVAEELVEKDKSFHRTWIMHPTKYLRMSVKPLDGVQNNQTGAVKAKVYEHKDINSFDTTHITDVYLGESRNFEWEICSPKYNHLYELRWD